MVTGEALRHAQACSPREDRKKKKNLFTCLQKYDYFDRTILNGSRGEQVGAGSFTSRLAKLTKIKEEKKEEEERCVCLCNAACASHECKFAVSCGLNRGWILNEMDKSYLQICHL